jgi:hypothetical protein
MTEQTMTQEVARAKLIETIRQMTEITADIYMKSRPMFGGVFGSGRYGLCSLVTVEGGIDCVSYFVRHTESGAVIAFGRSKHAAMEVARDIVFGAGQLRLDVLFGQIAAERAFKAAAILQARQRDDHDRWERATKSRVRSIPRRRQRIFDECGGKCHYCATALTLDGKWHVEHKMPKALGGGNEPGNLVASCAPCNHEKRDTTDVEFKAKRAAKNAGVSQ